MKINGRIKFLVIARSMRGGGAERFLTTLLRYINRSRFMPILGLIEKKGPFLNELPDDIEVIDLKATRTMYALPKIISLIRERKPDIVFSSIGYLSVALESLRLLIPKEVRLVARETNIPSLNLGQSPFPKLFFFCTGGFTPD